jgi:GNAT superfamily N-acetyltransferase
MITVAAQRLKADGRSLLVAHFLALSIKDRYLRFGTPLAPSAIADYVDRIDFAHDAVFGVHDDRLVLVAAAHVAFEDDVAELGLSVLPAHRGRGIGGALFERAVAHARNRCIRRLFMHFLAGNEPIMRIARRFGMDIVTRADEADAHLQLPPASLVSIAGEFVTDSLTLCGRALKALAAMKFGKTHAHIR